MTAKAESAIKDAHGQRPKCEWASEGKCYLKITRVGKTLADCKMKRCDGYDMDCTEREESLIEQV